MGNLEQNTKIQLFENPVSVIWKLFKYLGSIPRKCWFSLEVTSTWFSKNIFLKFIMNINQRILKKFMIENFGKNLTVIMCRFSCEIF